MPSNESKEMMIITIKRVVTLAAKPYNYDIINKNNGQNFSINNFNSILVHANFGSCEFMPAPAHEPILVLASSCEVQLMYYFRAGAGGQAGYGIWTIKNTM